MDEATSRQFQMAFMHAQQELGEPSSSSAHRGGAPPPASLQVVMENLRKVHKQWNTNVRDFQSVIGKADRICPKLWPFDLCCIVLIASSELPNRSIRSPEPIHTVPLAIVGSKFKVLRSAT